MGVGGVGSEVATLEQRIDQADRQATSNTSRIRVTAVKQPADHLGTDCDSYRLKPGRHTSNERDVPPSGDRVIDGKTHPEGVRKEGRCHDPV